MAIEVAKVELKTVQDASGVEACIRNGQFKADEVIAVIGKTEGNGGVNDFTRILADQAFRAVLLKHGSRSEAEIAKIPMVWSGGCDGVITPHATVFARNAKTGPAGKSRLVIGTAMSAEMLPEDIGRPAMVEKVADGVNAAMHDAGIYRSDGRALRADQDAAADRRLGARCAEPRQDMSPARCTIRWACRTARPASASPWRSARSRCRRRRRSAATSISIPRSRPARRASN